MHMFGRIASGEQLELHLWLRNADGLTDDKKRLYFCMPKADNHTVGASATALRQCSGSCAPQA